MVQREIKSNEQRLVEPIIQPFAVTILSYFFLFLVRVACVPSHSCPNNLLAPALSQWLSLKRIAFSDLDCICIHRPRRPSVLVETFFFPFSGSDSGGGLGVRLSGDSPVEGRKYLYKYPSWTCLPGELLSILILDPARRIRNPPISRNKSVLFSRCLNLSDHDRLRRTQHDSPGLVGLQHGARRLRHNGCQEAWRSSTTSEIIDFYRYTLELYTCSRSAVMLWICLAPTDAGV